MITVDDNYKKLVKNSVREIDSFVEILVNGEYFNADTEETSVRPYILSDDADTLTKLETVADDNSIYIKYASLENNYMQLDGSFVLYDENFENDYTGFIGKYQSDATINIVNPVDPVVKSGNYNEKSSKRNITIYFDKLIINNSNKKPKIIITLEGLYQRFIPQWNMPTTGNRRTIKKEFVYTYDVEYTEKDLILTSDKLPLNIIEHDVEPYATSMYEWEFVCISNINIYVQGIKTVGSYLLWLLKCDRIRIKQINLGETVVYDNKDIIEIDVNEQTDIDNLETPNNNCSIIIDNYDRKFNVVDNNNIINKLTKESIIIPYYGIGENGYYNYQIMGNYEYNSFEDNNNMYTVINGIGSVEKLESENPYPSKENYDNNVEWFCSVIFNQPSDRSVLDYRNINNINYNGKVNQLMTKFNNKREQAQALALFSNSFVKQLRIANPITHKNMIILSKIINNVCDTITLNQQLQQPKFKKIQKTKEININNDVKGTLKDEFTILYEDKIYPETNMIYGIGAYGVDIYYQTSIFINSDVPIDFYNSNNIKVYVDNVETNNYIINEKSNYEADILVRFDNTDIKAIKITGKSYDSKNILSNYKNPSIQNGSVLDISNNYLTNIADKNRFVKYVFDYEQTYEFEIEIMADPSLEVGDMVIIETVDGNKIGIIEMIEFKYNGGLTARIKGVCADVL